MLLNPVSYFIQWPLRRSLFLPLVVTCLLGWGSMADLQATSGTRGLLGLMLADYVPEGGLEDSEFLGSEVVEVTPGLPAARAGLLEGDVIVAVDEVFIRSTKHLQVTISEKTPGTVVAIKVVRPGQVLDVPVRITSWEAFLLEKPRFGLFSSAIQVRPLDAELRTVYRIPPEWEGLVVVGVDEQSIYRNILEEGSLILKINQKPAQQIDDILQHFHSGLNQLEILESGVVGSLAIRGY